jgi:hypothetical protein
MIRFLLNRITLLFFLILMVGLGGGVAIQLLYVAPKERCEKAGNWWAEEWRQCAKPIDVRKLPKLPELPAVAAPQPAPKT